MTQRVFSEIAMLADATLKSEMAAQCENFRIFLSQILREINFGKITVFAILGSLNVDLVDFSLRKVQKFIKDKNSVSLKVLKW